MFAFAPAGDGGLGRSPPAALPLCAPVPFCEPAALGAGAAVLLTLLLTGFSLPQAEWLALPEHVEQMKERPREFWRHFAAVLLALCGLDTVTDLAGVVGRRVDRPAGRRLAVVAVKAVMLHALLALAVGSFLADPLLGHGQVNLLPFLPADYAGQWGELAVAVLGDVLLLMTFSRVGVDRTEAVSAEGSPGDGNKDQPVVAEATDVSATPRRDG